jgi:hypothetical protein
MVLFPAQETIEALGQSRYAAGEFFAAARANGLPYLDLTPAFIPHPDRPFLFLWPWNGHLRTMGNQLVAEKLAPWVRTSLAGSN